RLRRLPHLRRLNAPSARSRCLAAASPYRSPLAPVDECAHLRDEGTARDRVEIEPEPVAQRVGNLVDDRSEEHTSELQSRFDLVCRLLLEKKKTKPATTLAIAPASRGGCWCVSAASHGEACRSR